MDTFVSSSEDAALFRSGLGEEVRGAIRRLARLEAAFEVYALESAPRVSEVLSHFRILLGGQPVYSGRAVVKSVVDIGNALLCEVTLSQPLDDTGDGSPETCGEATATDFKGFLAATGNLFKVAPAFKLAVADIQTFLMDFQRWTDRLDRRFSALSSPEGREQSERQSIEGLTEEFRVFFGELFLRFEKAASGLSTAEEPIHKAYVKRHLHPLVLCAPFMRRTFEKPLGYAGDYEMVNMMMRDSAEGEGLFARILNCFFLSTPPVVAHRNRIERLEQLLVDETCRAIRQGRHARILSLGCGPAKEVQNFIETHAFSDQTRFTLIDFDEQALQSTARALDAVKRRHHRRCEIHLIKKTVAQLLRESGRIGKTLSSGQYDFAYCAGLFDYLPNSVCAKLIELFYESLAPGGLLLVTNVEKSNPSRRWMEYAVDWNLVHRDRQGLLALARDSMPNEAVSIEAELSGVNIFLHVRKRA